MKIGILTFHRAENFGAVLQCYALQELLIKKGHSVKIIDYRPAAIEDGYRYFNIKYSCFVNFVKDLIVCVLALRHKISRKRKYKAFRTKYFSVSDVAYTPQQINHQYDMVICGSDQIWNLRLTNGLDKAYFLDFETSAKRISLSASSEARDYSLLDACSYEICRILNMYEAISVREEGLANYIEQIIGKKPIVTCDPTFLQDKKFYNNLLQEERYYKRKYVLVYNLIETNETFSWAQKLAIEKKLDIITVHAGFHSKTKSDLDIFDAGPIELLGYIRDAEYIVTTSFHGLAFSLILNKQFFVIDCGPNIRLKNLLEQLDLTDRIVNMKSNLMEIDYVLVNEKINDYVRTTINFINNYIHNA